MQTQITNRSYTNIGIRNTAAVFLDTNIAIDLVARRQPFYNECAFIEALARKGSINILISGGTVTTMIYIIFERLKVENANKKLIGFFKNCETIATDKPILMQAMSSKFRDKEDAYQYYTALKSKADSFLTRDMDDFKSVVPYHLPVLTPLQFEYMLL